jgi:hypothetical protein
MFLIISVTKLKFTMHIYSKPHFPCGCLSTLAPLHSAHVWMRRYLRVVPHTLGESSLMCINTEVSCIYTCTKLHWRGVERRNMHVCRLYYYAPSVRCCWALCVLAIMQSSLPLWLFEHSGSITLCACPDASIPSCCTTCAWWEHAHVYKYGGIMYLDVSRLDLVSLFIKTSGKVLNGKPEHI